jgi:hypothetical protein
MSDMTNSAKGFDRRLLEDPTKIESVCLQCGAAIIGSVLCGLPELEATHLASCKKPNASICILPSRKSGK